MRVLVTDDQTLIRAGLARLMAAEMRLRMITQTVAGARNPRPAAYPITDVLLTEPQEPNVRTDGLSRFDLASSVVQILVLAPDIEDFRAGDENGLVTLLGTDDSTDGLVSKILAGYPVRAAVKPGQPEVSKRELVVLAQVAAGLSNKQIGRLLGISQKTVRNHLSRIFNKLGAGNRTEAVMNAMRMGLLNV